jgi:integrase
MSVDLRAAAVEYLAARRARGYQLADHDWLLASFLDGLDARGLTTISVTEAVVFARARPTTQLGWQAARLRVVRDLAAYVHALDPAAAQLIPARLLPDKVTRRIPYLYSDEQVAALMTAAAGLTPPALAASMHTLVGLLAVTGMRSGEALALAVEDLDTDQRVLAVTGKYGRRRLVPLHPTTLDALTDYCRIRAHLTPAAPTGPLLVGAKGGRLNRNTAYAAFSSLVAVCRLPARPGCRRPRLYDFRHTFAVNSLIDAHRHRVDVEARIAALATYLGHVDPAYTYWYLTASPQLMGVVSDRISAYYRPGRR